MTTTEQAETSRFQTLPDASTAENEVSDFDEVDLDTFVADDAGDGNNDDDEDDSRDDDGDITWATAAVYWTPTEAQIARLRIESAGIPVVILDENLIATDWQLANALGGIKVQVPVPEVEAARSLLARPSQIRELSDEPVSDGAALCLRCGSPDIYVTWLSRRWSFVALFFCPILLPLVVGRRKICVTCGFEWRPDADPI